MIRSEIGTFLNENCASESTTLTNYTNTMSITLLNSTMDKDRFRSSVIGLLMSEMANQPNSPQTNQPSGSYGTQQQPIIIVQPPAQQIYFNQPSGSSSLYDRGFNYDTSRPERNAQGKKNLFMNIQNFIIFTQKFCTKFHSKFSFQKYSINFNKQATFAFLPIVYHHNDDHLLAIGQMVCHLN